ncbi:MAG: hypothetical protein K8W52_04095 [Deltaproteobacteria bacterium]|nr:hypothetical protein [Deltaproteobacteria bacterium]
MIRRTARGAGFALALAGAAAGGTSLPACGTGSVDVVLDVPDDATLAPDNAATVTLVTQQPGAPARATTSVIADDGTFDLGKLPVAPDLAVSVILRSNAQRVVGYGRAAGLIDVSARDAISIDVPMRRPFAYATGSPNRLVAFDTTMDAAQRDFQRAIDLPETDELVAASGGDVFVIDDAGGSTKARRIDGATHQPDTATIALPAGVRDAAATSNGRWLVVGFAGGMAIVDVPRGTLTTAAMPGGVDRVTIAATSTGELRAIGLAGRATTAAGCTKASQFVVVTLPATADTEPSDPTITDAGAPLADIGGDETDVDFVAIDPCADALIRYSGGEVGAVKLADVSDPAAVAMMGGQAWALGSVPGKEDTNSTATLSDDTTVTAAHLVLVSAAVDGSATTKADLPPVTQIAAGYDANNQPLALSRDINAKVVIPRDLVAVPPGDQVALLYDAEFHAPALFTTDIFGNQVEVIPEITAQTSEYELLNASGGAPSQRVLSSCKLTEDNMGAVAQWRCQQASGAYTPTVGEFIPGNLAVLYGAR